MKGFGTTLTHLVVVEEVVKDKKIFEEKKQVE